ncbi:MAG: ATPase domain-containing protein [Candidatus Bathyarchaeia archaeon]
MHSELSAGKEPPNSRSGLDLILRDNSSKGNLILLAGNPGTGKTCLSMKFLVEGTLSGESGVYVSFVEDKDSLITNMSRHLGCNLKKLQDDGQLKILDLVAMKEDGVHANLEIILEEVKMLGAKRIVIDSFSAIAQAFKDPLDVRSVVHTVLSRMIRSMKCTTIMIEEMPLGESKISTGIEEFIADAVILLRTKKVDDRLIRELEIKKLRGESIPNYKMLFTLKGCGVIFQPYRPKRIDNPKRFQGIPDLPDTYSTGIPDLDTILDGGYPAGSSNLLEVDSEIPWSCYAHLVRCTELNFLVNGNAFITFPFMGRTAQHIRSTIIPYIDEATFDDNARIVEFIASRREKYVLIVSEKNLEEASEQVFKETERLRKGRDRHVFSFIDLTTIEHVYGRDAELKVLGKEVANIRHSGDTRLYFTRPSVTLTRELRDIVDIHLRMRMVDGTAIIYGVRPHTGPYHYDIDISRGYPIPKLTPIA